MTQTDLEGTLAYQIGVLQTAYPIGVEYTNAPFTPTLGVSYIKVDYLHADVFPTTIGSNAKRRAKGVLQFTITVPYGTGSVEVNPIAEALKDHFQAGTNFTYNGITVVIENFYFGSSLSSGDWYRTVVNAQFRADLEK